MLIEPTASGLYYLDEPTWIALRSTRRRLVFVLLAIVGLAALYFATVAGGHALSHAR